ncbi:PilZ domain-containing protein [Pseudodesulfovibrio piezophilus]|uniref:PilZ domain-containing protein n=1 Tax=Pseudodesulfovibrio piezophilus (strain DSM 21447 / JCM 15486 / C1TLV30) TaxID=1322246 RepID=M1WY42_PSEP2|nr:PilZ domain-containing protein [Pseudodesulfovibrio piezophilus]CCH50113.1 protein of unknown function [Pseudodesulfovibrio piezophilus C1TLV30]
MSEDVFPRYSISGELALDLETIAKELGTPPEALLEAIVEEYIHTQQSPCATEEERRSFQRVEVNVPAIIYIEEENGASVVYQPALLKDISPIGIRIVCSGKKLCGRVITDYPVGLRFEIIFAFTDDMDPIRFQCVARRIEVMGEELQLGALITGSSDEGQKAYEKLLKDYGLASMQLTKMNPTL